MFVLQIPPPFLTYTVVQFFTTFLVLQFLHHYFVLLRDFQKFDFQYTFAGTANVTFSQLRIIFTILYNIYYIVK